MWVIVYHCPKCLENYGSTAEFSHDHCFDEPETIFEERICSKCLAQKEFIPSKNAVDNEIN